MRSNDSGVERTSDTWSLIVRRFCLDPSSSAPLRQAEPSPLHQDRPSRSAGSLLRVELAVGPEHAPEHVGGSRGESVEAVQSAGKGERVHDQRPMKLDLYTLQNVN